MPIIGKLLKKTTKIGYKRNFNKGKEYFHQVETLKKLLEKAKFTKFGFQYKFNEISNNVELVEDFQQLVPITDYDRFYDAWLKDSILGVKDNTWPGRIKFYALSSGTTGSPSKRIPVSEEMIRSFQKTSMRQITMLHELDLPESFYSANVLVVGGCTKLNKKKTHIEGDLSGILKKHTSFILSPFAKPGNKITGIKDWNVKMEMMIEKAPTWNIGVVAGVPSRCIMLMEKIIERYQLNSIHDIWPNFDVYVLVVFLCNLTPNDWRKSRARKFICLTLIWRVKDILVFKHQQVAKECNCSLIQVFFLNLYRSIQTILTSKVN